VLTKNPKFIQKKLEEKGMTTFSAKPNNSGYAVSY